MTNEEKIAALEKEAAELKAKVAHLCEVFEKEGDNTTEHFGNVYALITEIIDYLMPVVHKIFPGIGEGKKEIAAFLKRRPPASDSKIS